MGSERCGSERWVSERWERAGDGSPSDWVRANGFERRGPSDGVGATGSEQRCMGVRAIRGLSNGSRALWGPSASAIGIRARRGPSDRVRAMGGRTIGV